MEEKVYYVMVEKMNRLQSFFFCILSVFGSYAVSDFLYYLGIEISESMILILFIGILCFLIVKFEWFAAENLEVIFQNEKVIFRKGTQEKEIFYADIKEVEKIMVINRYHGEKGYYRVKIKMKKRSYALYSGEDSGKQLDFSQTGISKVYFEFQNRGIKSC